MAVAQPTESPFDHDRYFTFTVSQSMQFRATIIEGIWTTTAGVANASRWQMIKKIKFWAALPHIAGGIKVAVQQSIIGAVIAEFIASGGGLGFLILNSLLVLREGMTFGVLIVLMVFAVVFYKIVSTLIDALVPGPGGV